MYETTSSAGGWAATTWIIILAVYLYFAFTLYKIACKTGYAQNAWWGFIPILNLFLLVKMAGRPMYWFLFLLIPFLNLIMYAVLWIDVAKACRQSPVWGFLCILPIINLISMGVIAFSGSTPQLSYPTEKPAPRQPSRVG
ncbi:MAG TPA: DUF5684 domain-containing protein [Candidatus Deferrimicrobium sp.]|nr:DUF5684 domain-containing protein [Candidatus Deferrimicrobium sp.]